MCFKVAYKCKRQAKTAGRRVQRDTGRSMRVYECQTCGHWHLTSTPRMGRHERVTYVDAAA